MLSQELSLFMRTQLSISQRLHKQLEEIINNTEPGERLPSEPDLSKELGVSRATLREAMRTFETQGLLYRRQGSGTYVTHPTKVIQSGLEILESIETLANKIGLVVSMGELLVESRQADDHESSRLGIAPGSKILQVSRVIHAEGHSVAYLIDILPDDILTADELDKDFTGSVLDILLKRGTPVLATSRCEINAVTASPEIARLMHIQRGDVLLRFEAYLYSTTGRNIDYSQSYFLPGYFQFHVVRRIGQFLR